MSALNRMTNRHLVSALCAAPILFSCAFASAEEAAAEPAPVVAAAEPAEPEPPYTLDFNLGLYSRYMFRGVDLSDGVAIQGGIDWAHSSGFYLGAWFSNLDPDFNGRVSAANADDGISREGNHVELDLYGGYAYAFENGLGLSVSGTYYAYPEGHQIGTGSTKDTENTFEAFAGISYKWLTYTYSRVLTDYYGTDNKNGRDGDTKGAEYHELKFEYKLPVGDLNLMAKVGRQTTRHIDGDQSDFAIGIDKDFSLPTGGKPLSGFNAGAAYTTTFNVKDESYYVDSTGQDVNDDMFWVYVKRSW